MGKFIDLTGQRFGTLVAIETKGKTKLGSYKWLCKCDCGNFKIIDGSSLRTGNTKSCGCATSEYKIKAITKIPNSNKRLVRIYHEIKDRCFNHKTKCYKNYGGRKITICNEWLNPKNGIINFYNWAMKNGYKDDLTIDRINNDGNYEPNNCRWVTRKEQQNNRRNNVYITYNGQTKTMKQWSEILNIKYNTIRRRIKEGFPKELYLYNGKITQNIRKEYETHEKNN